MLPRNDYLDRVLRNGDGQRALDVIGGYRTHVLRSGAADKAAFVWFPAVGDPVASFAPALVSLASRLRGTATVIAVDPPGFGDSSPCADGAELGFPGVYAWGAQVLHRVVESDRSVVVAGNSSGAAIAVGAAVRASVRIAGAILVAWPDWRFGRSPQADLLPADLPALHSLLERAWHVPPRMPAPVAAQLLERLRMPAYRRHVESFDPTEASALLGAYAGPLAFVAGRNDRLVTPEMVQATARAFPRSEIRWIEQCGHYPHREKRDELVDVLTELSGHFLGGVQ